MTELQLLGKKGTEAVKELRLQKLGKGYPFMINSNELESRTFYLEFPDGTIQLACSEKDTKEFTMIRELSTAEAEALRAKYGFSPL